MLLQSLILCAVAGLFLEVVATARAQTMPTTSGKIILDTDSIRQFEITGRQMELAKSELIKVQGQPFTEALRVTTSSGSGSEWNVQLSQTTHAAIKTGDVLLARFWMRCTQSMTSEGFIGFVYEMAHPEFDKAAEVRLAAGAKWRECFVRFRAPRDFPADEARVCLRVGYDTQTIELGGLQIINYGNSLTLEDLPRTAVSYAGRSAEPSWRKEAMARIEKIRKGDLKVIVSDSAGQPIKNASVHAVLKRHAFGFGSCVTTDNLLDPSADGDRYREIVEKYFNRAVFENDMKWQALDGPVPPRLDQALQWLLDRNIKVRGHNLVWPSWKWLPKSLKPHESNPAELAQITSAHITSVVGHFRDKLIQWDVVNEPYTNHDLIDLLGGEKVMVDWFKLARQADPDCKLYLNDYGILEGSMQGQHARHFFGAIKSMKDQGAPIDGIGIQSHFAAALPSPTQLLQTLDHFSELGLPIELTELSLNLDDRDLQADYMRDFLIAAFSHPNVHGVMLWGFWEKRHWRPEGALFNADWSLRPHGRQWIDLVHRQWKTDATVSTATDGVASTRGFLGEYEITVSAGGKTKTAQAILSPDGTECQVKMD